MAAGIVAGIGLVAYTTLGGYTLAKLFPALPGPLQDIKIGAAALVLNVVVALAVSLATQKGGGRPGPFVGVVTIGAKAQTRRLRRGRRGRAEGE